MPRRRYHASNAERQRAYRQRMAELRLTEPTIALYHLLQALQYARDNDPLAAKVWTRSSWTTIANLTQHFIEQGRGEDRGERGTVAPPRTTGADASVPFRQKRRSKTDGCPQAEQTVSETGDCSHPPKRSQ